MSNQPKPVYHYKNIGAAGHCLILAQMIGEDSNTGEEIPTFFAVLMITKEGKLGNCMEEAADLQRITNSRGNYKDLVQFCYGYSSAAQERRGVSPQDWRFKQTIDPKNVERPKTDEVERLRAWPEKTEPTSSFFAVDGPRPTVA